MKGQLSDRFILVVEDEYMLADELCNGLEGAKVVGPVASVEDAIAILDTAPRIDGAILDTSLQGEMVFPFADMLATRGVPFLFATGYDRSAFPDRFAHVAKYEKPINTTKLTAEISRILPS